MGFAIGIRDAQTKAAPAALDYTAEAASGCAERCGPARLTIRRDVDRSITVAGSRSIMRR